MTRQTDVKQSLIVDLLPPQGPAVPVRTVFSYRPEDPWAVTFSFRAGARGRVDWTMCRNLLRDGLTGDTGEGDVRIGPDPEHDDRTLMRVESPDGCALFSFDTNALWALLVLTTNVVPFGHEHAVVDLDAELGSLLTTSGEDT